MKLSVAVEPSKPVTVTVYVPADNPVMVAPVAPLLQLYVHGSSPAVSVEVILPSLPPLHLTESTVDAETERLNRGIKINNATPEKRLGLGFKLFIMR